MRNWLWASLLLSTSAYALDMGEIKISSGFNQPLVATIPLELTAGTNLAEYTFALQGMPAGIPHVELTVDPKQPNIIKLTSKKPLTHNNIQFDILAKAKNDELRQAYTVTFEKTKPQVKPQVKPQAAPAPKVQAKAHPKVQPKAKAAKPDETMVYGPVQEGETLWNVAKAFSQHYGMPLSKAMEQLYEHNQRAFGNGKRDALLAGSFLSLPPGRPQDAPKSHDAPKSVAVAQPIVAKSDIRAHQGAPLPKFPKLEEEGKAVAVNLENVTGSLELLIPSSDTMQNILGKDDQAFVQLLDKIQSELSFSREAIDTERRAKEALQTQLDEVQIQIKALTELIHLKDTEMKSILVSAGNQVSVLSNANAPVSRFIAWDNLPANTAQVLSGIANNQLALLFLAIAVASFMVYLWDHLSMRRGLQVAMQPAAESPRKSTAIKTQSLQAPPFMMQDIDVYVAHGRYSQAEDMLELALEQNPNDFDVLYKLFQVYVKSDNRFAYENKTGRISARWKQKFPARWQRVQDLFDRAWPMGFEGTGSGGGAGGDDAYEGDPPSDPVQTKLELAKAYIDIGNHENAVEILIEVVNEGNEAQVLAAQMLLSNIKH